MSLPGVESARRRRVSHERGRGSRSYPAFLLKPPPLHRRSNPQPISNASVPLKQISANAPGRGGSAVDDLAEGSGSASFCMFIPFRSTESVVQESTSPLSKSLDERAMAARHRLDARLGASAMRASKSNPVIRRHSEPAAAPSQQQVVAAMRMAMLQRKWGSLQLDQGSNAQCHVCSSGFKDGQMAIDLPCRHTFHSKCIIPWLHNHTYCPACKASISIA